MGRMPRSGSGWKWSAARLRAALLLRDGRVGGGVAVDLRLEAGPIRLALDDEVVGGIHEAIDGALGEQDVVEHPQPLGGVAVAGEDDGGASGPLDEELINVLALLAAHGLEGEVVDDEQVDGAEGGHLGVVRVVESTLSQKRQHLIGAQEVDVVAMTAGEVTESVGDEGLADADGPENDDVPMRLQEAQRTELCEELLVEGDLGRLVEPLERHVGVELGVGDSVGDGGVVAPCDLVGDEQGEDLLERHTLRLREVEPLGQRVEDAAEAQAAQRRGELRGGGLAHCAPLSPSRRVRNACSSRAKRGTGSGSCTTLPPSLAGRAMASLSMRPMRRTSTTSKLSADWQTASTRPSPYLSQRDRSAYAARICVQGNGPPRSFSANRPMWWPRCRARSSSASMLRSA